MPSSTAVSVLLVSRRCSLRSALAQACLRHVAPQGFIVHACGMPGEIAPAVDPRALDALRAARIGALPDAPRSWAGFTRRGPRLDLVIVLDEAVAGLQPDWPEQPDMAVWAYPDLVADASPGLPTPLQMLHSMRRRFEILSNLPMRGADRQALRGDIRDMAYLT